MHKDLQTSKQLRRALSILNNTVLLNNRNINKSKLTSVSKELSNIIQNYDRKSINKLLASHNKNSSKTPRSMLNAHTMFR